MYPEERIAHWSIVAVSVALVLRSLDLVHGNFFVVPWYDQWSLVLALARTAVRSCCPRCVCSWSSSPG